MIKTSFFSSNEESIDAVEILTRGDKSSPKLDLKTPIGLPDASIQIDDLGRFEVVSEPVMEELQGYSPPTLNDDLYQCETPQQVSLILISHLLNSVKRLPWFDGFYLITNARDIDTFLTDVGNSLGYSYSLGVEEVLNLFTKTKAPLANLTKISNRQGLVTISIKGTEQAYELNIDNVPEFILPFTYLIAEAKYEIDSTEKYYNPFPTLFINDGKKSSYLTIHGQRNLKLITDTEAIIHKKPLDVALNLARGEDAKTDVLLEHSLTISKDYRKFWESQRDKGYTDIDNFFSAIVNTLRLGTCAPIEELVIKRNKQKRS